MTAQSDAQKVINSVKEMLRQRLKNGAYTRITYGVVAAVNADKANVYVSGDTEVSEDFRIPLHVTGIVVGSNVRVTITPDAHKWIDERLP